MAEMEQIYAPVTLSGTFYIGLANSFPLSRNYLHGKITDTLEKTSDHILALPFLPRLLHGPPRLLCPLWFC